MGGKGKKRGNNKYSHKPHSNQGNSNYNNVELTEEEEQALVA